MGESLLGRAFLGQEQISREDLESFLKFDTEDI